MRKLFGLFALTAVAAILSTAPSRAQQGDFLGSRTVADRSDTDTIQVPGGQLYSSVRLCAAVRSVHFQDIDIHFANGGSQDVSVRLLIGPGECTRWVDLNGGRRNITRIVLRYQMIIDAGQQTIVSAYGR